MSLQMFTNETVKDTPIESNLALKEKAKNHFGGFTYKKREGEFLTSENSQ